MPLTASGQEAPKGFTRIMAMIEALILASVFYIANGVQEQKIAMAEIKASLAISQQQMSNVPQLTIRMAEAEKDIQSNTDAIKENKQRIDRLENRSRLGGKQNKDDFSL